MNNAEKMFLLVAEEMSITKAAQKAAVTQQCASDYIRKLETKYGVPLFNRRPRLSLTEAGKLTLRILQQTQKLEGVLAEQLQEVKGDITGRLTVGMNPTRARILLPSLLNSFRTFYPKVVVSCFLADTKTLSELLLNNKIDLFLGVDTTSNPNFIRQEIGHDPVFFLTSQRNCSKYVTQNFSVPFSPKPLTLETIAHFSITRNLQESTLNNLIDRWFDHYNITLQSSYYTSDYDTQIAMCGEGFTSAFCPLMVLNQVIEYNHCHDKKKQVVIFPLSGINDYLRVDVVTQKNIPQPLFLNKFAELLQIEARKVYEKIKLYN
jgi:DNA-binding transcriptional LysR family regulator